MRGRGVAGPELTSMAPVHRGLERGRDRGAAGTPRMGRAVVEVTAVCSEIRGGGSRLHWGRGCLLTGEQNSVTCSLLAGTQLGSVSIC